MFDEAKFSVCHGSQSLSFCVLVMRAVLGNSRLFGGNKIRIQVKRNLYIYYAVLLDKIRPAYKHFLFILFYLFHLLLHSLAIFFIKQFKFKNSQRKFLTSPDFFFNKTDTQSINIKSHKKSIISESLRLFSSFWVVRWRLVCESSNLWLLIFLEAIDMPFRSVMSSST